MDDRARGGWYSMSGVLTVWAELSRSVRALDPAQIEAFARAIGNARSVFVTGLGRSGAVASAFANRLMHAGLSAHRIGEFTVPAIGDGDLLVAISASGRLLGGDIALAAGAQVAGVTATANSPLARAASTTILIASAGSAQPMGSLFEQTALVALDGVVLDLMTALGQDDGRMRARHANIE
ncbi:MAG: SIS domain-containing protein [Actinomycetaceae bacterium]|nr:SIS domain-containing protein [Actinomycetaceae bacterium]